MAKRIPALCMSLVLTACASADVGSYVVPGESLAESGSYYIVFAADDDRALHELLREGMVARDLDASSGFADRMPEDTTYLVEYGSQWQWDVTWYLLHLNVRVYEPGTRLLIASAHSRRSSLVRKPPEEVVAEALNVLFDHDNEGE